MVHSKHKSANYENIQTRKLKIEDILENVFVDYLSWMKEGDIIPSWWRHFINE